MQSVHFLFPRRRLTLSKPIPRPAPAASAWRPASHPFPRILCLRPAGQVTAADVDELVEAVGARVRATVPPPCSVVLDLSATPVLDEGVAAALQMLAALLGESCANLRLVLPAAQARSGPSSVGAGRGMGPEFVHGSVRAAVLDAYASLPGAALVTPALRELLAQPPQFLALPSQF
jgi:hypothetical protein